MRGAGCTWNDFLDKEYDKNVTRTKDRPLASDKIKTINVLVFLVVVFMQHLRKNVMYLSLFL